MMHYADLSIDLLPSQSKPQLDACIGRKLTRFLREERQEDREYYHQFNPLPDHDFFSYSTGRSHMVFDSGHDLDIHYDEGISSLQVISWAVPHSWQAEEFGAPSKQWLNAALSADDPRYSTPIMAAFLGRAVKGYSLLYEQTGGRYRSRPDSQVAVKFFFTEGEPLIIYYCQNLAVINHKPYGTYELWALPDKDLPPVVRELLIEQYRSPE